VAVLENNIHLGGRLCRMQAERSHDTTLIRLFGEFVLGGEEAFEEELRRVIDGETSTLIVDLRGLDFIDSTGLGMLLSLDNHARQDGFDFTVFCGNDSVRAMLRQTGLDGLLRVVDPVRRGARLGRSDLH
jgi:anti-sigma B factor antagonist